MTTGLVFGPVPSRRLGRSLGVNHVPRKHCSYSCVYCQVVRVAHRGRLFVMLGLTPVRALATARTP